MEEMSFGKKWKKEEDEEMSFGKKWEKEEEMKKWVLEKMGK